MPAIREQGSRSQRSQGIAGMARSYRVVVGELLQNGYLTSCFIFLPVIR
jgi:hypothetical protein